MPTETTNENDKKNEIAELLKKFEVAKPKDYWGKYQDEITNYITSKLAKYDVPLHTMMEIAQYAMCATALVSNNELRENCRICRNRYEKSAKRANRGAMNGSNTDKQND